MNKKTYKLLSLVLAVSLVAIGVIKDPIFAADRYSEDGGQSYDGAMTSTPVAFEYQNVISVTSKDWMLEKIIETAHVHHVKLFKMIGQKNLWTYTAIRAFDGIPVSGVVIVVSGDSV